MPLADIVVNLLERKPVLFIAFALIFATGGGAGTWLGGGVSSEEARRIAKDADAEQERYLGEKFKAVERAIDANRGSIDELSDKVDDLPEEIRKILKEQR